ncbi:MAG: divergent polysaccharide deacetylase family protein [Alphaproteobacteria bacterium]|nr:divergent polysaccharide deacetylase family protein [Alphaproteobacteria bacterium]
MAAEDADVSFDDNDDDYLKSSDIQEKLPQYALYGTTGFAVLLFLGVFVWLQFPSESIEAELRAMRPQMTMRVPPMRRSARDAATPRGEAGAERSSEERTPSVPEAAKRRSAVLHPHPDPKLVERSDIGMLPIIGTDGRKPWRVYSRPFNVLEKRPRIAIVMTGLGVSFNATESVVGVLPGEVTLAFAPYAQKLKEWIDAARGAGHEVLINLPMEPRDYPRSDPGPFGLLTGLDVEQNRRRLDWVLSRMTGYVGVTNYLGDRFTSSQSGMRPVLRELERRGLMFLDSMESNVSVGPKTAKSLNLPLAISDRAIDVITSRADIDRKLAELETIAKTQGVAVALARPYPVTIRRLQRWIRDLDEKGLALAPITAVVNKQSLR